MRRTFKYKINTNNNSKSIIDKHLELCCWLHNHLLKYLKENNTVTKYQLINSLVEVKREYPFLKEVQSQVLQEVAKQVYKIWNNNKQLKKIDSKKKYPNFKPTHRYNSLTYPLPIARSNCGYKLDNFSLSNKRENRQLKLTLGQQNNHNVYLEIKVRMERNFEGDCKTLTIKRKNGKYYTLLSCANIKTKSLPKTNKSIGIDVNLNKKSYITLSNGVKYNHPQHYKKVENKLKELSRSLSKKQIKSQNWKDTKFQLSKNWEKIVNQFKHYSYQVANDLVKDYDNIAIEKLQIKNMIKNKTLSKSIQQARWGILFKALTEKTEIVARSLVRVNPINTTQTCSNCNTLTDKKLKLSDRRFKCSYCSLELDRDINSARNILTKAECGFDLNPPL